jgi:2-succinyl-5-enolpyruvyl-6-hydroxy-3-cyclohexene-1-carboxylate synthase
MTDQDTLTPWVATIVGGLVAGGVADVVVSPGSRSTPLALTFARHPQARLWMHYDERSAGFFALGMARTRRAPVALLCTSGTAAANYLPAVAEADLARVPLIVLTADRPHELRDNGAPQTIDQVEIYGSRTRWAIDLPEPTEGLLDYLQATVARAIAAASGPPAGPVHLNLPFREPLVPNRARLELLFDTAMSPPVVRRGQPQLTNDELDSLAARLAGLRRGLILAGPDCEPGLAAPLTALAAQLGFPILADPLSGLRSGPHDRRLILGTYDAFLRDAGFVERHSPEIVLRFGAMPTCKPVLQFLQRYPQTPQIIVDAGAGWREPTNLAETHLVAAGPTLCAALLERLVGQMAMPQTLWSRAWLNAERASRKVISRKLAASETLSEPRVFSELAELLPEGAALFVGNSMPVRDLDTFFPVGAKALTIAGNRGANGIDGLVSTGLGMAAGGHQPLLIALGDLSLYHDSNGLLAAKLHDLDATIVLINNDGGGIFSFLPQASEQDSFETLFGTPHGLDFAPLAALYGARHSLVENWEGFRTAVREGLEGKGLHIVEVRTDRTQNLTEHRAIWPAVTKALRESGLAS